MGLHAAAQVSMKLAGESEDRLPWESPTPLDDGIRESLLENDPRMSPALDAADIEGAEEGAPSSDATLVGLTRLGGVSRSPRLPSRYLRALMRDLYSEMRSFLPSTMQVRLGRGRYR